MVRDASKRATKYEGKIDGDVQRSRIIALKASMVDQQTQRQAELAVNETNIKAVVEGQATAVYGHQMPAYLNVGRELLKLSKKFTGLTFTSEAKVILDKWKAKGLNQYILKAIAKLYGVTY